MLAKITGGKKKRGLITFCRFIMGQKILNIVTLRPIPQGNVDGRTKNCPIGKLEYRIIMRYCN